jgi:hypothetical protein
MNFSFFRYIAERLPLCILTVDSFVNLSKVIVNSLAYLLQGFRRVLATFLKIAHTVLARFVNVNYLSPSNNGPEDIDYPLEQLAEGTG